MINKYALLCIASALVASLSQVLLKISANRAYKNKMNEYLNGFVIIAYGMLFFSTLLTIISLRGISLSSVPAFESAGYFFVMIMDRIFFKERITFSKLTGNILIIIGILIFHCKR